MYILVLRLKRLTYCVFGLFVLFCASTLCLCAQDTLDVRVPRAGVLRDGVLLDKKYSASADTVVVNLSDSTVVGQTLLSDSLLHNKVDSVAMAIASVDSLMQRDYVPEKTRWIPDPKKAMWLAIVFPGGGQIYNRKYWKLPIVYGGLLGCVYALNWNNTMYRDYSQAYIDIMDEDPNTKSYENFIPPSYNVNQNLERIQSLFKRKKDYYRRYRDLSIFCMIGVYALSIVDAYVDAELSSFDISHDLSMKVHPAIINDRHSTVRGSGLHTNSYGLQCSFNF